MLSTTQSDKKTTRLQKRGQPEDDTNKEDSVLINTGRPKRLKIGDNDSEKTSASETNSYSNKEEDLLCQICYSVPKRRSKALPGCNHWVCMDCLQKLPPYRPPDNNNPHQEHERVPEELQAAPPQLKKSCPVCRSVFNFDEVEEDEAYSAYIKTAKISCKDCSKLLTLSELEEHECEVDHDHSHEENEFKPDLSKVKKNTVTFTCPYCGLKNLDREGLIKHVEEEHAHCTHKVVCPICVSHAYGDPNYKTHLLPHLKRRHAYDMDDLIEDEVDEDEVLRRVLELSMQHM